MAIMTKQQYNDDRKQYNKGALFKICPLLFRIKHVSCDNGTCTYLFHRNYADKRMNGNLVVDAN